MDNNQIVDKKFLAPLHQHFINLMCSITWPNSHEKNQCDADIYNISAFIVEILGDWYAITAGHIFNDLTDAQNQGAKICGWKIDDSILTTSPMPPYPIALDIDSEVGWFHDDVPGIDYACLKICSLARTALKKQGIRAISSEICSASDLADFSSWVLVGTPTSLAELSVNKPTKKRHVTVALDRLYKGQFKIEDKEYKRFYARIKFSSTHAKLDDLSGMSGGPIFGLKPGTTTVPYDYRIIGVQSSWNKEDEIAICNVQPFIEAISKNIKKKMMQVRR